MTQHEKVKNNTEKHQQSNLTSGCFLLLDPSAGEIPVIIDLNACALEKLGYARDELIGQPISFLYRHLADQQQAELLHQIIANQGNSLSAEHRCKDNSIINVDVYIQHSFIAEERLIYHLEHQPTERLQQTLSDNHEGVFGLDLQGNCIFINPAAEKMLQRSAEELIGHPMHHILHAKLANNDLERAFFSHRDSSHKYQRQEMHFYRKDGSHFAVSYVSSPAIVQTQVTGVVVSFRETREQKEMGNLLIDQSHILEMLAIGKPLPDILDALNLMLEAQIPFAKSSILLLNSDKQKLLIASAPSLSTAYTSTLENTGIGPDIGSCGTAAYWNQTVIIKCIETDPLWVDFKTLAREHGLKACWSVPIHSATGTVLGTFALYPDHISQPEKYELMLLERAAHLCGIIIEDYQLTSELHSYRQHLEALVHQRTLELIAAKEAAEAASVAKSRFIANMSHELKTPLNAILGFTEITLETELNEDQNTFLQHVSVASRSLLSLINNILDFDALTAQKLTLNSAPFETNQLFSWIQEELARQSQEKDLQHSFHQQEQIPAILNGDFERIKQVMGQLIDNAVKFTESGNVAITVLQKIATNHLQLIFAVQDTGMGIAVEDIPQLFNPFTQLDASSTRRQNGTGIGLSLCEKLAKLMHGSITIESLDDQGSTFVFSTRLDIPQAQTLPSKPTITAVKAVPDRLPGLNILEGIHRLGGDRDLYYQILQMFLEDERSAALEIAQAIGQNNLKKAQDIAHKLRGSSGNIGADKVYNKACTIEYALKHHEQVNLPLLTQKLIEAQQQLTDSINSLLRPLQKKAEVVAPNKDKQLNLSLVLSLLDEIRLLLLKSSPAVDKPVQKLMAELATSKAKETTTQLLKHTERYDFDLALESTESIYALLDLKHE
ncbi:MAG: ATP-binding protein [Mariprofundus sp.]|nr:ATP-binding protein [Mariprofundus sp.]